MSFIAYPDKDFDTWGYIMGNHQHSIAVNRYYYLLDLFAEHSLKVALKDPSNDYWTKWVDFPGPLWETNKGDFGMTSGGLTSAIDVHRSMFDNEIVIESDYPEYAENYDAAKIIGKIIEEKGFKPMYYYSGNKSVHIHIFFDWNCLKELDLITQDQLRVTFLDSKLRFKRKFIKWLRTKMISCWDLDLRKFDSDLINGTHLIRCELSRNKLGYKTFLGYTYKDMSFVPYVCNEKNRIYPQIGKVKLSSPNKIQDLIEEFIEDIRVKKKSEKVRKRNHSLQDWGIAGIPGKIRECVKRILSEDFKKVGDGFQRGMFILLNELRMVMGDDQARILINDWNGRMGFPVKDKEITYRFEKKSYSLPCDYVHKFLKEVGLPVPKKCGGER